MADYSAGQKKKGAAGREPVRIGAPAHLGRADELYRRLFTPRGGLRKLILQSRPTLLFVEHDRAFCDKVATAKIEL